MFDYNVTTKHGQTDKRFVKSDIEEIKQYLRAPEGIYVLTDKDLRLYEDGKGKNLTSFKVLIDKSKLEKGKKQQYLEIIRLSD